MLPQLILLAQDTARFNRGQSIFQLGLTGVGVAIIIMGAALCFSKPKDPEKATSPAVKWTALGVCGLLGLGIIAYAWLGFSAM